MFYYKRNPFLCRTNTPLQQESAINFTTAFSRIARLIYRLFCDTSQRYTFDQTRREESLFPIWTGERERERENKCTTNLRVGFPVGFSLRRTYCRRKARLRKLDLRDESRSAKRNVANSLRNFPRISTRKSLLRTIKHS